MANKKISELANAAALTGGELVELVQSGSNVKVTTQQIADLASGGVPLNFATWNGVTFPTPSLNTLYVVTADHGSPGDGDYIPAGAWMIGPIGASVFSDFYIKP